MATGTEGLGLPSTVFDFSGIAEKGLEMEQLRQKKREQFAKDNAFLYDTPDTTLIRDVDSPFINEQAEKAMELNTRAVQTKRPEDIQAARNQMALVSRTVAESRLSRQSYEKAWAEIVKTPEYKRDATMFDRYNQAWAEQTAMTSENKGKVGEALVYQQPVFYEQPEKNLTYFVEQHASDVIRGASESTDTGVSRADGTGWKKGWKGLDQVTRNQMISDSYDANMAKDTEFQQAMEHQVMARYFGTTDLQVNQVARFNEMKEYGDALRQKGYESVEDLRNDSNFANNPRALRMAEEAFTLEAKIDEMGRAIYSEAMRLNTEVGEQTSSFIDQTPTADGDGGSDRQVAINRGKDITGLLGSSFSLAQVQDAQGNMINDMPKRLNERIAQDGSALGWSSAPNLSKKGIGTGSQGIITGGLISSRDKNGNVEYYVVEYKPSKDAWSKLEASDDIQSWLAQTDARIVPLSEARGRILEKDLELMKQKSDNESLSLQNENKPKEVAQGRYGGQ